MPKTNEFLKEGRHIRSVVDISKLTASDGSLPKQIQVLPVGSWLTQPYGPMEIDEGIFSQMVANFVADVRKAVPIDVDHDGGKAAGWINGLINKGSDGLWADVEWTKLGKELLGEKIYRLFSPEWSFDYVDPEKSTHHGAVLIAGSLTNRPLFKELPLLVASDGTGKKVDDLSQSNAIVLLLNSEDNKSMPNIEEILKKPVAERTADELKFIEDNKESLSDEQKAQLEAEVKPADEVKTEEVKTEEVKTEEVKEEVKTEEVKTEEVKTEEKPATETPVTASEDKEVTIKASELKTMKEQIATLTAAEKRTAAEKEFSNFVANENGGKLMPVAKEKFVEFILTCSETQKASFLEIVKTLPDIKIAGQKSSDDNSNLTATEEINKLISEKIKASEGKLSIVDATKSVLAENSELAKRYNDELKSK